MGESSKYERLVIELINKMDLNKLFSLFNKDPEEELRENLITYKNTPKFKLEMFSRIILEGVHFKTKIVSFFTNSNAGLEGEELAKVGDFMMFTRAWFWISQFELDNPEWSEALNSCNIKNFQESLKICIQYFEDREEFEKCSFLVSIRSLIKVD